jgi:hypothetical protein
MTTYTEYEDAFGDEVPKDLTNLGTGGEEFAAYAQFIADLTLEGEVVLVNYRFPSSEYWQEYP